MLCSRAVSDLPYASRAESDARAEISDLDNDLSTPTGAGDTKRVLRCSAGFDAARERGASSGTRLTEKNGAEWTVRLRSAYAGEPRARRLHSGCFGSKNNVQPVQQAARPSGESAVIETIGPTRASSPKSNGLCDASASTHDRMAALGSCWSARHGCWRGVVGGGASRSTGVICRKSPALHSTRQGLSNRGLGALARPSRAAHGMMAQACALRCGGRRQRGCLPA